MPGKLAPRDVWGDSLVPARCIEVAMSRCRYPKYLEGRILESLGQEVRYDDGSKALYSVRAISFGSTSIKNAERKLMRSRVIQSNLCAITPSTSRLLDLQRAQEPAEKQDLAATRAGRSAREGNAPRSLCSTSFNCA